MVALFSTVVLLENINVVILHDIKIVAVTVAPI